MTDQERDDLMQRALDARRTAYAPYSQFQVGAALRTARGETFTGVNVENASYGLTLCAERVAAATAVAAGVRQFQAMAIASPGGASPCGACRQFLAEFAPDLELILVDANDVRSVRQATLAELLPDQFQFKGPGAP